MRRLWLLAFALAPALSAEIIATFDQFPEGFTSSAMTDAGITFSNLDDRLPEPHIPVFVIEATTSPQFGPEFSPPNYLNTGGVSPGDSFGFGRFGSAWVSFGPSPAVRASLDVFNLPDPIVALNMLTLEAYRNGNVVRTDTIAFPSTGGSNVQARRLSVSGVLFDQLRLIASGPQEQGVVFIGIDNVRVEVVPEPAAVGLCGAGMAVLLWRLRLRRRQ